MFDVKRLIYLHGSESDSNSGKARQFQEWFPGMLTPDFKGSFDERMKQLYSILSNKTDWTLIGSSFGGLMGALYTHDHPTQVRKLILLAPALTLEPFASRSGLKPVSVYPPLLSTGRWIPLSRSNLYTSWYKKCLRTLDIMSLRTTIVCINQSMTLIGKVLLRPERSGAKAPRSRRT